MSSPLIFACLWVLLGAITAMLPMRLQFAPGLSLLVAAPILLIWIASVHGIWIAVFAALAVISMFRRPLMYFGRKALAK